jgi:ubiquinone/menaquinone biosynthesis C-methylase UbiE
MAEPKTAPLWAKILDECQVGVDTQLLDMGCGGGGLAALASKRGAKVHGLDAAESLIAVARERVPSGEFEVGDIESLPFADASFDVVTASNSIQFADDQRKAVMEAKRVLKAGGRFGIGMWCEPERCEMGVVFKAVQGFAPPATDHAPPSMTDRDNLVALVESGRMTVLRGGEVECMFDAASVDEAWRSMRSAGIFVGVARAVGEEALKEVVVKALEGVATPTGEIRMRNWFRYLICS